jgi:glucose-1-phosphatase
MDLVYLSVEQLRNLSLRTLENPPVVFHVALSGIEQNADGLYTESDLLGKFDQAIQANDQIVEDFTAAEPVEYELAEAYALAN